MRRRHFLLGTAAVALSTPYLSRAAATESTTIYYNADSRFDDTVLAAKALKLALSKCDKRYVLQPSPVGYATQPGAVNALRSGAQLDIIWVGTEKALAEAALPVLFPIDGGLLGYRLFLINQTRQPDFSKVKSLEDLRRFIAIQGPGWGDIDILRNSGLTVRTGLYKNLFRMTVAGRADYFPRAAFEALNEQAEHIAEVPGLAVEESLILKYPFCLMFYVSKARPELRRDIEAGLIAAHQDGSYQAVFKADANIAKSLTEGHLDKRTVIDIPNPNMPDDVAAIDRRFWFSV